MRYMYCGVGAYLLLANLVGYFLMWSDKRKAKLGKWRIPESKLILIALLGGSIGVLFGMKKFRHKTKHAKFYIGIPVIFFIQIVMTVMIVVHSL